MKLTQLKKAGEASEALARVSEELRRSHDAKAGELERSVRPLDMPEAAEVLIEKRDTAYARMHGLLHALWTAPVSGTLRPHTSDGGNTLERHLELFRYPVLTLITDSRSEGDPEAEHNYGLVYPFDVASVRHLQGLGSEGLVYSESAIELRIANKIGDPRAKSNLTDATADFLGNVDTLERVCKEAGIEAPAPIYPVPKNA